MKNITITFILMIATTIAFATETDKVKKSAEVTPTAAKTTTTFNVGTLTACDVEADDEDALDVFEETATESTLTIEPLTEDMEESVVVEFK